MKPAAPGWAVTPCYPLGLAALLSACGGSPGGVVAPPAIPGTPVALPSDFGERRVMLFTDAQPNVGATSPSQFQRLASAGAARGVGLTTFAFGVGIG